MTKKQSITLICIATMLMAVVTVGVTYAYWRQTLVQTGTNELSTGCFNVTLTDEKNEINLQKAFPISDEAGAALTPFTFKITNTCDTASAYTVNLEMLNGTTLSTQYVDVLVNDGDIRKISSLPSGTKNDLTSTESRSIESGVLKLNESKEFSIRLWLDKDVTLEDDAQNKVLTSKIVITSEATEIASVPAPVSFEEDSWETIAEAVRSGNYPYQVGDTKTITIAQHTNDCAAYSGSGVNYVCTSVIEPKQTITLRIVNTTKPSECENDGFSQTACGFVIEFADIIEKHNYNYADVVNENGTNIGGWRDSSLRTYINTTIFNSLPTELQNIISETYVISGHGNGETENIVSTDKLYLLSAREIWLDDDNDASLGVDVRDKAYSNTRQLDYYENLNVSLNNYQPATKNYQGNGYYWWLRTALYNPSLGNDVFMAVNNVGNYSSGLSSNRSGISPAFRIA